jgi:heavy metal sensor kinase
LTNISISLRLTGWFCAIFLTGFVVFGITMWLDLAYSLGQGRDRTMIRRASRIVELMEATRNDPPAVREARLNQLTDATPEGNLIHILDASGRRLYPKTPTPADFPWPPFSMREAFASVAYDGRSFRVHQHPKLADPPYVVVVAGQLEDNRNMMARFTTGLTWSIPAMLAISALGGYVISRRALRPVDQITGSLRSISIGNLSQRLPTPRTRDELQRLTETCNDMLARLQDAVERINRFTADASHELRSPVALIRTVTEYALRNPRMDVDSREAFEEILAEAIETSHLLEDMLTLARADAGYTSSVFEPVDLTELMRDVCAKMRSVAEVKKQYVTVNSGMITVLVNGDRSSLRRLLSILLDNAIKYTPVEGRIQMAIAVAGPRALLTVTDSGIGIPEALLPRIFDRFVRADPSRGVVNGTGLGLAIAKWIAEAHGASVSVLSKERQGSVFRVDFPLDPSSP